MPFANSLHVEELTELNTLLDNGVQVASSLERIQRMERKREINRLLAKRIVPFNVDRALRIAECSSTIERYEFSDGSDLLHSLDYCGNRFCAICAERRSRRLVRKYAPIVEEFARGKHGHHIVLTLRDSEHMPTRESISRLLRNLWRRGFWKRYGGVFGGFYSVETTYNSMTGCFHCHVHCLVFLGRQVPSYRRKDNNGTWRWYWQNQENQLLSDEWSSVTKGEAYIVRAQPWDGRIFEMLKYMVKHSAVLKMDDQRLGEYLEWSAGTRALSAFGELYGLLLPVDEEEEDGSDIDGEESLPVARVLIRKTRLEYDDRLRCFVAVSVEECNDT